MCKLISDSWKIIQVGFSAEKNRFFESIMSTGNGRMGLRGNHEEDYLPTVRDQFAHREPPLVLCCNQ